MLERQYVDVGSFPYARSPRVAVRLRVEENNGPRVKALSGGVCVCVKRGRIGCVRGIVVEMEDAMLIMPAGTDFLPKLGAGCRYVSRVPQRK